MQIVIECECPWCRTSCVRRPLLGTYCHKCDHRADVPCEHCDCLACTARKLAVPVSVSKEAIQSAQVDASGIRAGRLLVIVTEAGVTRRIEDAENPAFHVEIFESAERSVEVFKVLWSKMALDKRTNLLMALRVLHLSDE